MPEVAEFIEEVLDKIARGVVMKSVDDTLAAATVAKTERTWAARFKDDTDTLIVEGYANSDEGDHGDFYREIEKDDDGYAEALAALREDAAAE